MADTGVAYWLVLSLAGAIAALGLTLDSAAVIIGAMLIAPLLAPVVGLALALSVGDARLAVQAALLVLGSTIAVVAVAALITLLLPFHTVTPEITARTRPTTLDLIIAGCSGLAGAVVSVSRGRRLAAAVPGVAVAVALVPPLAVAGFGIGTGWNAQVIRGSLLLYSANLAGIVMSGMLVFLAVGMNRPHMRHVARDWHEAAKPAGAAALLDRLPGVRSLGMLTSLWGRLGLMAGFIAIVALPLRASLRQIARETRVRHAVATAVKMFRVPGRSVIVSQDVEIGTRTTRVLLDVATTHWFDDSARVAFDSRASHSAGEPVSLLLQQLPAAIGDIGALASMLTLARQVPPAAPAGDTVPPIGMLRPQLASAVENLVLPDSTYVIESAMVLRDSGPPEVRLAYAAPDSLGVPARQMIARQMALSLIEPRVNITTVWVSTAPLGSRDGALDSALDSATVQLIASRLQRYPRLSLLVQADSGVSQSRLDTLLRSVRATVPDGRIHIARSSSSGRVAVRLAADIRAAIPVAAVVPGAVR